MIRNLTFFSIFVLTCVTTVNSQDRYSQEDFINMLNIEVGAEQQPEGFAFLDMGAWHGYGFNNPADLSSAGGLRGPVLCSGKSNKERFRWVSDCFEKLSLQDSSGTGIPYTSVEAPEYLPGMLRQEFKADDFIVNIRQIAVSDRSTMTEYTITSTGKSKRSVTANLSGKLITPDAKLSAENNILTVEMDKGRGHLMVSLPEGFLVTESSASGYWASGKSVTLRKGKSATFYTYATFCPVTGLEEASAVHSALNKNNPRKHLADNKTRWEGYINSILQRPTEYLKSERNRQWAVKAMMTLNTNWRSAAGDLKHAGIYPAINHFDAFWAWDSWEHAMAASIFNPELGKDQMCTMFDYQTPEGMIVDLIALDKKDNNNYCSKPPIAGWATYFVYKRTGDKEFLAEMFPKLMKYHEWRYKYRDHDGNGLCEYGGTVGQVYVGQWESGMDVAVKFDGVKMLENSPGAWSFDQESVELNSYLCAEKFYLAFMAEELGNTETAAQFREEGRKLRRTMQEKFFDPETGFFYDIKMGTGEHVKVIDISGWIPLFMGVATREQAESVKNIMLDPEWFGTYFPFSSLNHKHPQYHPAKGYFRGQTWMNYTYFGIRGFKNYGFTDEARIYTTLLPDRLIGIADPGYPIRENYNSETGEGMTAKHFSWSSAFSILLLAEDSDTFPYIPDEYLD